MRQSQPNQPRGDRDHSEAGKITYYPVFRLFIAEMVDSSGFPSASDLQGITDTHSGYRYGDAESGLLARIKYLHLPVADTLAQSEREWANRGISKEARQAIKDALKAEIEKYLIATDPKGAPEEEIRTTVQSWVDEIERDALRNVDTNGA